jgi:hypothetical protein
MSNFWEIKNRIFLRNENNSISVWNSLKYFEWNVPNSNQGKAIAQL